MLSGVRARRAAVTVGIVVVWMVMQLTPVPGIDPWVFLESGSYLLLPSLLILGLEPFFTACIFTEVCSLVLPPLTQWRRQGIAGRIRLLEVSMVMTLFMGLFLVRDQLQSFFSLMDTDLVFKFEISSLTFTILFGVTSLAGLYVVLWTTRFLNWKGMGHGISIFLLVTNLHLLSTQLFHPRWRDSRELLQDSLATNIPGAVIVVLLIVFVERIRIARLAPDTEGRTLILRPTVAGFVPLFVVASLPAQFGDQLSALSVPVRLGFMAGTILVLTTGLGWLFYRPGRLLELAGRGDNGPELHRFVRLAWLPHALYLCVPVLLSEPAFLVFGGTTAVPTIPLIFVTVILIDVLRQYRTAEYVPLASFDSVPMVDMVCQLLHEHQIAHHVSGYHHRAMLHFFGPFIQMTLRVPEEDREAARRLVAEHVGQAYLPAREALNDLP